MNIKQTLDPASARFVFGIINLASVLGVIFAIILAVQAWRTDSAPDLLDAAALFGAAMGGLALVQLGKALIQIAETNAAILARLSDAPGASG